MSKKVSVVMSEQLGFEYRKLMSDNNFGSIFYNNGKY